MHSSATSTATRAACSLAIEISRTGYSPLAKRQAVVYTSWRAVSILVAISANLCPGTWNRPLRRPHAGRRAAGRRGRAAAGGAATWFPARARGPRHAARGADQPLALELPHDVVEALADLAEDGVAWDTDLGEREQRGVGGVHAQLLEALLADDARQVHVDQEEREAVVA